jgi:DNA-3-methyladenine glycosylase
MGRRVGREFFDRATVAVARALLGATLVVRDVTGERSVRLVETEAYVRGDPASHAFRGRTRRNRSMFGPPGTLYVYRIHQVVCANLVTRTGEAVLLRAGVPLDGTEGSATGPGRLCRTLGVTIADDGRDTTRDPRVSVMARTTRPAAIDVGPRVGIRRATERPLRFAIRRERAVSSPRPGAPSTSASSSRSRGGARSSQSRTRRRRASGGGKSAVRSAGR